MSYSSFKQLLHLLCSLPLVTGLAQANDELAEQSQNPLAALSTVLFEYNYEADAGPDSNADDQILNIKPVYPVALDKATLIARAVVPLIDQDERFAGQGSEQGLGDINLQAYYVPKPSGGITWGVGPSINVPSNTDNRLGVDQWSAGPALAVIAMPGDWVIGLLTQNLWDVAGESGEPDVNQFLFQYFLNYNFESGWYLTSTPIITADWEANSDDRWRIPVGGGVGKVVRLGSQAIDLKLQAYKFVESADTAPDWSVQFNFKLLFPR